MNRAASLPAWTAVAIGLLSIAFPAGSPAQSTSAPSSYSPTTDGLTQFFKDMLDASDARDTDKLLKMSQSLVLPDPDKWFKASFGNQLGTKLSTAYKKDMKDFPPGLVVLFLRLKDPKHLEISVVSVDTPDDPNAKMYQVFAMQAMKKPQTLYSMTIRQNGTTSSLGLWSFVHTDGQFRLVGKMMEIRDSASKP